MTTLKFTRSHEWVKFMNETTVQIGLTDHAQQAMGDLVFVNLPEVGDSLALEDTFADVESVKAVSDVFSPVAGEVSAINEVLLDAPETINQKPYEAWLVEISNVTQQCELLNEDEYQAILAEEV